MHVVTATFSSEQAKQEGSHPIDMYIVNASLSGSNFLYYINMNQDVVGFQMDSDGNLTNTEQTYTGLPINHKNITSNIDGEISSVEVSIPNTDRAIEAIIQDNDYLRGSEVYILSTFADYLPASTLVYTYIGTTADKNAIMKEKLYIDGVSSNEEVVTFTCKPKFTIKNVILPLRRYSRECSWEYGPASLASECRVAQSIYETYPTCNYTLASCEERSNATRFGGFVGVPRHGIYI